MPLNGGRSGDKGFLTVISHGWMAKGKKPRHVFKNISQYSIEPEVWQPKADLWPMIEEVIIKSRSAGGKRVVQPLHGKESGEIFLKISPLSSIPSKVRATLAIKRRSGLYDWPLEELSNHAKAQKRTQLIPRLLGYGVIRQRNGLVSEIFLNYEHLKGWDDAYSWLKTQAKQTHEFAKAGLELILQLNRQNIYHLDLWAGNMMLNNNDISNLKAIDLENCFIGNNPHPSETLGFQFAFLYQHQLSEFIPEPLYDQFVKSCLAKVEHIEKARFNIFYEHFKHHGADRKERHLIPKTGRLPQLTAC